MHLCCELIQRRISALPGLYKAVVSHNFSISSRSWVHPHHTFLSCTILLSQPIHWATTSTLSYIDPLCNPVVFSPLYMAETSENTFINLFIYTLRHPTQLLYPCIWGFIHSPDTHHTSEVVHLYSPNPLLLFPYHCLATIRKNRHQQWFSNWLSTLTTNISLISLHLFNGILNRKISL